MKHNLTRNQVISLIILFILLVLTFLCFAQALYYVNANYDAQLTAHHFRHTDDHIWVLPEEDQIIRDIWFIIGMILSMCVMGISMILCLSCKRR